MFNNYLKLAFKVLGRRRFYTFVSLFGISFTLMVLMVIMAFLDTELGANAPMSNADRMVLVDRMEMKTQHIDTIWQLDSNLVDGLLVVDTTGFDTEDGGQSNSTGSLGFRVVARDLADVEPLQHVAYMYDRPYDVFSDGKKYQMRGLHTNADYWDVMDFKFLEGRPFQHAEDEQGTSVLVVTDHLAREYFGTDVGIVGRKIPLSGRQFEVVGMVERPRASSAFTQADIYLTMGTADALVTSDDGIGGPFRAVFLAPSAAERKQLQDALDFAGRELPIPADQFYEQVRIFAFTPEEKYAHQIFWKDDIRQNVRLFRWVLFGMMGFFILIPTLNLVNLNLSRMLERAGEIGVRKSFGASSGQILMQFLFENVVITLLGGLIGLVLAWGLIYLINSSGALPTTTLTFSWRVFGLSFALALAFGLLSGLLPAWRMSKLQIVSGLRG